jgi:hypothetical protein
LKILLKTLFLGIFSAGEHLFRSSSHTINLNLNPCHQQEFNCHDGSCVKLDWRCDGSPNCPGGEDEMGCDLLQLSASYVKGIPPRGNNSIVLSMAILNVTDVRVLQGLVKTHLEINLLWSDNRSMVVTNYSLIANLMYQAGTPEC